VRILASWYSAGKLFSFGGSINGVQNDMYVADQLADLLLECAASCFHEHTLTPRLLCPWCVDACLCAGGHMIRRATNGCGCTAVRRQAELLRWMLCMLRPRKASPRSRGCPSRVNKAHQ
jgi:hypothetical protein